MYSASEICIKKAQFDQRLGFDVQTRLATPKSGKVIS
jgi:hypothetical protein